jgi:hypothetical protein
MEQEAEQAPSLYQFQKLKKGQKPQQVLQCALCEQLNHMGKVLLPLDKEARRS